MKNWMKCMVACMFLFMGTMGVMAQKNINKVVEELEKSDEASINSVTRRDPKTRKITRVVKTFSLTDIKMAKRLIAAFEKDEEYAISAMKDIRRVYMYHGAEHKCINCIERGRPLTVRNVKKSSRKHKRCGTSFLLFVMLVY